MQESGQARLVAHHIDISEDRKKFFYGLGDSDVAFCQHALVDANIEPNVLI
jgi:hypothetical protein